jgi:electron transfer flavoprotein alpha subunit
MKIIVYIQSSEKKINPISLESLVAAQKLKETKSAEVYAATFSGDIASKLTAYDLDGVMHIDDGGLAEYSPLHYIEAFKQIHSMHSPDLFMFGHTYETRDWVPRLSARLDIPFLSDCIGMDPSEAVTFTRALYQNKINADLSISSESAIVSFQSGAYKIDALKEGSTSINLVSVDLSSVENKITNEDKFKETDGAIDLSAADFIVSIGRGIGKEENIPMAKELADLIGAQLASSRPVVDSGWLNHSLQIGSSGQIVSPKLYFALGISGAIQHSVGMKGSSCILVINKDSNAPIFEIADYGVVGDIMEIVPKLSSAIKELNG